MKVTQHKFLTIFSNGTLNFSSSDSCSHQQILFSEKDHKNSSINKKVKTRSKTKSNYFKDFRNKYI